MRWVDQHVACLGHDGRGDPDEANGLILKKTVTSHPRPIDIVEVYVVSVDVGDRDIVGASDLQQLKIPGKLADIDLNQNFKQGR